MKQLPRLYIAGAVSGVEDYQARFDDARQKLLGAGFLVFSPATGGDQHNPEMWPFYMRRALQLLLNADAVAVIARGAFRSRGVLLELTIARTLNMPISTVDEWIEGAEEVEEGVPSDM
jgi:hypothetical protein